MYIHERIASILKERGLSQKNLADATGIKQSAISDWKSKNTNPSAEALIKISEYLDISLDYLMIGTDSTLAKEDQRILSFYHKAGPAIQQAVDKLLDL